MNSEYAGNDQERLGCRLETLWFHCAVADLLVPTLAWLKYPTPRLYVTYIINILRGLRGRLENIGRTDAAATHE